MSPDDPDFNRLVGPLLQRVSEPERPPLLAALERVAARRYRGWAEQAPARAEGLLACAAREEQIADIAEGLFPPDAAAHRRIESLLPEARGAYEAVFQGLPLQEQWRIQAIAERTGAAAWRAFAAAQHDARVRDALLRCAALEEESALHLEALAAADETRSAAR